MKQYRIQIDVTMSGDLYIEANSQEEAEKIAKEKHFTPSDLRWFHQLGEAGVYDIEEEVAE